MSVNQVLFVSSIRNDAVSIITSDASNLKTLLTAGASGARIEHLKVTSTDTTTRNIAFYVNNGGSDILLGLVPVTGGASNVPVTVDALALWYPFVEKQFLLLKAGAIIKCKALTTVTAAQSVDVYADGGDY